MASGSPSPPSRTSTISSDMNYPCPSEVNVANFVALKLDQTNYYVWKQLMLNLIESHELEGFVDGTTQPPPFPLEERKQQEYRSWKRSDGLVSGWVFVTVTEEILPQLVHLETAREAWIAIEEMLGSSALSYPCPSGVDVANFVPLKLRPTNYSVWKQLMLNFVESHELEGFVYGTIQPPPFPLEKQKQAEYRSWKSSDGLVRTWVFVTVTEEILPHLVHLETAREAWIALEEMLSPSAPYLPQSISGPGNALLLCKLKEA